MGDGKRRGASFRGLHPEDASPAQGRSSMELMDTAGTLLILVLALLVVRAVNKGGGRIGG